MRRFLSVSLILVTGFAASVAQASPCCGGGAAVPAMIAGDHRLQMGWSFSRSTVIGDAPAVGIPVFRAEGDNEVTQMVSLDVATLLSDRLQVGLSAPFSFRTVERGRIRNAASAPGDVRLNLAYEAIQQLLYSEWQPTGYAFLQLTLPTGKSAYEAVTGTGVDATGKGFLAISSGLLFVKRWSVWDANFTPELHYSAPRAFSANDGSQLLVSPGWGGSATIGVGVSPGTGVWRFGARLGPSIEQGRRVATPDGETVASYQLNWNLGLEAAYMIGATWSLSASYVDQTLFGPVVNSTLSRTFAVAFQRRWER